MLILKSRENDYNLYIYYNLKADFEARNPYVTRVMYKWHIPCERKKKVCWKKEGKKKKKK